MLSFVADRPLCVGNKLDEKSVGWVGRVERRRPSRVGETFLSKQAEMVRNAIVQLNNVKYILAWFEMKKPPLKCLA